MYIGARPETRLMYVNALNYATLGYATPNVDTFYPENIVTTSRTALYIPKNLFQITTANQTFVFTVGAGDVTKTLDTGDYTGTELAAHIQSKFGSNFLITYSNTTKLFGIKNTTNSFTLRTSFNPISWDVIGVTADPVFVGLANTQYYANESRIHTSIRLAYDMGGAADCSFFALLGERNRTNSLSPQASIVISLSNSDDITTAIDVTVTPTTNGCFSFLDGIITNPTFRYVWINIVDKQNVSEYITFSQLFIGGFVAWENRTINHGFTLQYIDRSIRTESVTGALFFERYNKYPYLSNLQIAYLTRTEVALLQQAYFDLGKSEHFYLSLDSGHMNGDLSEFVFFGVFDGDPTIEEVGPRYFNASFSFRGD